MALHLVTGYKGTAHITSADQGAFNAALIGTEDYVCKTGRQFEAQIMTNNSVRIYDGDLLMQGRHVNLKVDTYEDVTIENGAQGMNRNDLIVCRYAKDATSGQEAALFVVLKGTPTEGTASDPVVTSGDILGGAILHEMPLYRVKIEGLSIVAIQKLYSMVSPVVDVVTDDDMKAYAVPITRKVNGKPLNGDVTLGASDVGARPNEWTPTASDVGAVAHTDLSGVDLNTITYACCGYAYLCTNRPTSNNGYFECIPIGSGSICLQRYTPYGGSTYQRQLFDDGTWSNWSTYYLPLVGGTLSGQLNTELGISFFDNGANWNTDDWYSINRVDTALQFNIRNAGVNRIYTLGDSTTSLADVLKLWDYSSGSEKSYRFYGEHNVTCGTTKPTSLANGCIYEQYE